MEEEGRQRAQDALEVSRRQEEEDALRRAHTGSVARAVVSAFPSRDMQVHPRTRNLKSRGRGIRAFASRHGQINFMLCPHACCRIAYSIVFIYIIILWRVCQLFMAQQ